jgi:hypothetical protein
MRVVNVNHDDPNVIELNFMWLPTFIGQNTMILKELRQALGKEFVGKQITEKTLWAMHQRVIQWLEAKFPFEGVGKYLHAIEEVKDD